MSAIPHGQAVPLPINVADLQRCCFERQHELCAWYDGLVLSSAFQPIYSPSHQRTVGYEALVRAQRADGTPVSPAELFAQAAGDTVRLVHLDRLCRLLHVANFRRHGLDAWLFLNVDTQVVTFGREYGPFFRELIETYDLPAHRVVVEILEGAISDEPLLAAAVDYYRRLGCLIAIDDFGAGHSNFSRVLRIAPDIVKIDRSIVSAAHEHAMAQRLLPALVSLLREAGCFALLEGIETENEALLALDADIDFMQGYYLAAPASKPAPAEMLHPEIHTLDQTFMATTAAQHAARQELLSRYAQSFLDCAVALIGGNSFASACRSLLKHERTTRCYLLNAQGTQVGDNLVPPHRAVADPRFDLLSDTTGTNWHRRHYFRRALAEPGRLQTSRPYLSLSGTRLCITLSMALPMPEGHRVLCCDLAWEDTKASAKPNRSWSLRADATLRGTGTLHATGSVFNNIRAVTQPDPLRAIATYEVTAALRP